MDQATHRWDTLLSNALVFDGTGAPPQRLDVAIKDGRIAALGASLPASQCDRRVDLAGRWLMPGLLDIHTHLDLEVEIEPGLPECVRHGTTTVVVSNCSLGLAFGAQRRDGADPITDCFARVENVPKPILKRIGDLVSWDDSQAYLDHFDHLALGANIAPMIPHSMLRIEVMGLHDSVNRAPTTAELQHMGELLEKGLHEGYAGFSTDALPFHYLANTPNTQKQIPTQFATYDELKYLTHIVRRWGRTWQATPAKDNRLLAFRTALLTSGRFFGRTLKTTMVAALDFRNDRRIKRMARTLAAIMNSWLVKGHFRLQALAAPFKVWSDGVFTPFSEEIPVLRRLIETDHEDAAARRAILDDPAYVAAFRRMWYHGKRGFSLARLKHWLRMDDNILSRDLRDMTLDDGPVADWNGETLQAVYERLVRWQATGAGARSDAERRAFAAYRRPIGDDCEFFLEALRLHDNALRWFTTPANTDPASVRELLFHPQLIPGFNDSGAHLTNMAFYDCNLRTLKIAQAEGLPMVAHAVHRLTQEPAELFGLDVGKLEIGAQADIAVIDPEALRRHDGEKQVRYLLRESFGLKQLVNRPEGVVTHVWVGGKLAWEDGAYTPIHGRERLGRVLLNRDHERRVAEQLVAA
jgi:N-acyl-D-aspartate/D-glutamate deacylase